jgi:hypothetical protein
MAFHSEVGAFVSGEGEHFISFLKKEAEGPGLGAQIMTAVQVLGAPLMAVDTPMAISVIESVVKEAAGVALGEVLSDTTHEKASTAFKLLAATVGGISGPHIFSMALMGAKGAEDLGLLAGGIEGLLGDEAGALTQLNGRLSRGATARFDEQREAGSDLGDERLADFTANANEMARDADGLATSLLAKIEAYKARLAAFQASAKAALAEARRALARVKDAYLGFVGANTRNVLSASVHLRQGKDNSAGFERAGLTPSPLLSDSMHSFAESASVAELGTRGFGVNMEVWYAGYRPIIVTFGADGSVSSLRKHGRLDRLASRVYQRTRGGGHQLAEGAEDMLVERLIPLLRDTPISNLPDQTIDAL